MDIRKQIIEYLDQPFEEQCSYNKLKYCIFPEQKEWKSLSDLNEWKDQLDNWFKGVIESLYYRPNHYCLVLEGKNNIGKMKFFQMLRPEQLIKFGLWSGKIYYDLILFIEFVKSNLELPNKDEFNIIGSGNILDTEINKRLASYCSTTNKWRFPKRKNYIVLKIESIDFELYNSIDKTNLWREIFKLYKP